MSGVAVSVIITTLNSGQIFEKCLASVRENDTRYNYEIIVVDAGSNDGTINTAKRYADKVIVKNGCPPGEGRNLGVSHAQGDIVCFTDSDCLVPPNWIGLLIDNRLRLNNKDDKIVGVGGGNIPLMENLSPVELAISKVMRSPLVSFGARNVAVYKNERQVLHNPPMNSAYFRWVLEEVGGFGERGGYAEDLELDGKIGNRGYKLYYLTAPLVYHKHKSSLEKFAAQMHDFGIKRVRANREYPKISRFYHYGPLLLYLMLFTPPFFIPLAMALANSCYVCLRERSSVLFRPIFRLTLSFHKNYGAGELKALLHRGGK